MDQFKRDLEESGTLEEMEAAGEVLSVASPKSAHAVAATDDLMVPLADDDVEASVQLLEEGEDTGRIFALDGPSQDEAPDLLADNFVDDEAEEEGEQETLDLDASIGSPGTNVAAAAETSEEEDEAGASSVSVGVGAAPDTDALSAADNEAASPPPSSSSTSASARSQNATLGGMRSGFLNGSKSSSSPKTPPSQPQRSRSQRKPRATVRASHLRRPPPPLLAMTPPHPITVS